VPAAEGDNRLISQESGLSDLTIEISSRDALAVATLLDLGGLATKHYRHKRPSVRDSAIMENAVKKLGKK
jgi:hypothetical protein